MSRIGFFTLPHTGHLYPATALGRKLSERGHEVVFFSAVTAKAIIRTAGLSFYPFPKQTVYEFPENKWFRSDLAKTLQGQIFYTRMVLAEGPDALKEAEIDAVVVDQLDFATGTVAELLHLPFINLSIIPPIYLGGDTPPICFGWRSHTDLVSQARNHTGNLLFSLFFAPVLAAVNRQRKTWSLRRFRNVNDVFSKRAIVTQMPEVLDFPRRRRPKQLFYTGPFFDGNGRRNIQFPWERLTGEPLIYASMGTRRNGNARVFQTIAEACSGMDAQLVISLGGSMEDFGPLSGDPIIVRYAPQLDLISRANLTITHGGINTTLESLAKGVPLVAIPVSDDQPGVAARIKRVGAGTVVPFRKISVERLRNAISLVLKKPEYKLAVQQVRLAIEQSHGLERAADIVESPMKTQCD